MIEHVAVVIPARNEEQLIASCLESVFAAREQATVPVSITVVADGCDDDTAAIARSFSGVTVIELAVANVGAVRAAGITHALADLGSPLDGTWIANTDADSIVPRNWLSAQQLLGDSGWDVMIGTVRPDFGALTAAQVAAWRGAHVAGSPNGHVHGANLGVRASVYRLAGGFARLTEHEDVDLVARLGAARQIASDECEVETSARLVGRTPGGYAGYLRANLLSTCKVLDGSAQVLDTRMRNSIPEALG